MDLTDLDYSDNSSSSAPWAQAETKQGVRDSSVLIPCMSAADYHADRDALSCSMLKPLLISPAHFQMALFPESKSSDAKDFGTLLHLFVLEPHKVGNEVALYPGVGNGRDRSYKDFVEHSAGKLVVDEPTFRRAFLLAEKILSARFKGRPLRNFIEESMSEATVYFTEPATGLRLRTRMDAYHPDITIDLKSTRHGDPRMFGRDAVNHGYDLQAYMYSRARQAYEGTADLATFVFIAAESSEPHSVSVLSAGSEFIRNGARKFESALATYKACSVLNHWPDQGEVGELDLEPWQVFDPHKGWRRSLADII